MQTIDSLWDNLLPDQHPLKSENLKVLERSNLEGFDFKYVLVLHNNILSGVIYLQQLSINQNNFDGISIDKPGLNWLKKCLNSHFDKVLICGNIFRVHHPGFYFSDKISDAAIFEILMDFYKNNKDKTTYCGIVVKDCLKEIKMAGKFMNYKDDVSMQIPLDASWKTMEDYYKSLSKKYRQRYKKIKKSGETIEHKWLTESEIIVEAQNMETLYLNVASNQSLKMGLVNANYFIEMKKQYSDKFMVKGYYLNDKMLAFSSHIEHTGELLEVHYIGLDYAYNKSHALYFNILFDGVQYGIEQKYNKVEFGRTARLAKASLGAKAVNIHNYIYLKKGVPSMTFSVLNKWFNNQVGTEWQTRSPFL